MVSLYLLAALIYHHIKVEKPHAEGFFNLSLGKRFHLMTKYTCIFIAFASFVRHTTGIISGVLVIDKGVLSFNSMHQGGTAEIFCNTLRRTANVALTVGSGLVYLYLWLRQRVFYVHKSLKEINQRCLQTFSSAVLILWILFWISIQFVYFIKVSYRFDEAGICQFELDTGNDWTYAEIISAWTTASALMQVCLLGLLIYPILKRASWLGSQQDQRSISLMRRTKKSGDTRNVLFCDRYHFRCYACIDV